MRELTLDDGRGVTLEARPPQGTRHEVVFGRVQATGEPVVVKLEGVPGALSREAAALAHLNARSAPVPRLRGFGGARVSDRRTVCLVVDRAPGAAPTTRSGWRRMGRALGRLAGDPGPAPGDSAGVPVLDHGRFAAEHARRVAELGERLAPVAAAAGDWASLAAARIPNPGPLVLTHGDPGPGNFLDDGVDGWLIDWEDAQVAPRGLDIARAAFIARLGSGPSGYVGRDRAGRARAVVTGYAETVPGRSEPSPDELRWWLTVAGVQFIHHRCARAGAWREAVEVLRHGLGAGVS